MPSSIKLNKDYYVSKYLKILRYKNEKAPEYETSEKKKITFDLISFSLT